MKVGFYIVSSVFPRFFFSKVFPIFGPFLFSMFFLVVSIFRFFKFIFYQFSLPCVLVGVLFVFWWLFQQVWVDCFVFRVFVGCLGGVLVAFGGVSAFVVSLYSVCCG